MSPTPRCAWLLAGAALLALVLPLPVAVLAAVAVIVAAAIDARAARAPVEVERSLPNILSRGVPAALVVEARDPEPARVRLRQPAVPDVEVTPPEADRRLDARVTARRRGRHVLPAPAARRDGPLGLACSYQRPGDDDEVVVFPDMREAWRLALAVRQGRFRETGRATRGPLGLGTDFESIRDYLPDDDIRQVNWIATARAGRPMSNQYRVEQDRDVICVVDAGRLMSAPLQDRTRLDAAIDAVAAVALVADELGDRCGAIAFDAEVLRHVQPRRKGGDAVVRALFDVEPRLIESDYELAFRTVVGGKRSLMLIMTDLLDEAAAASLVEAVPVLSRRHAAVVASTSDPDLDALVTTPPQAPVDVYAAGVALDVLGARARAAARLRQTGAEVLEAPPEHLASACVGAYLRAKARARL